MDQHDVNQAIRNLQAVWLLAYGFQDTAFIFENWNEPDVGAIVQIVPNLGIFKGGPS
jgi:hypothetical protein